ncbi:MAG: DUF853 family protein [Synergistaceae bacterium]|nr:DUF853 family protein [Synergistaceae bacterium]
MYTEGKIYIAKSDKQIYLMPEMANRHGLIAGATGTGKTISLKVLAESFSDMGVPVFLTDIKGDLAGMCRPGVDSEDMQKRIAKFGLAPLGFTYKEYPTCFWDIYGEAGHSVRATISEMGPLLLARLLDLNDTQAGVLSIVFRVADDRGLLLLDLKDLRSMLNYVAENAKEFTLQYGNIAAQSVGAIQRSLLMLEDEGGDIFFGEPALQINDWIRTDSAGRGMINILHCVKLFQHSSLYATFLLWMLSELFEALPEVGDPKKPRMVFFFDEAHLLFNDAPKVLLQKIEQVVRLIRSKGVGVYFITQNPKDVPDTILAQLGNRIQHALRAYSPAEQKVVRAAAETFRVNPAFDTEEAITQLGTGEALVSFLQLDGTPSVVERAFILPPQSKMGDIDDATRKEVIAMSPIGPKYDTIVDRDSAYEYIMAKYKRDTAEKEDEENRIKQLKEEKEQAKLDAAREKEEERERIRAEKQAEKEEKERIREQKNSMAGLFGNAVKRKAINKAAQEILNFGMRSLLGTLTKRR